MDATLTYILLGFIVLVGAAWTIGGARIRQKLRDKGREKGYALDDRMKNGDAGKLGAFLTVANGQAASAIVSNIITQTKGVTPIDANNWYLRHALPEDLTVSWSIDANGQGTLFIKEAHEMFGVLVGTGVWKKLRESIAKSLTEANLANQTHDGLLVKTDRVTASNDAIWTR